MQKKHFVREIDGVDWSRLRGAYPRSEAPDVGEALKALARLEPDRSNWGDADHETWNEAMDALASHTWHQGDIYPVTPEVIPFVFELADRHEPTPTNDLARYIAEVAVAAFRYGRSGDPQRRRLAERVHERLGEQRRRIRSWLERGPGKYAMYSIIFSPALRDTELESFRSRPDLPFSFFGSMTALDDVPHWVLDRAEEALEASEELTRTAAAALIATHGDISGRESQLERHLGPAARARLDDAFSIHCAPAVPEVRAAFDGDLVEASVLVARPNRLIVRTPDDENVSIHWSAPGISRGDTVRVGLSPHGEARVLEFENRDGETERTLLPASR